MSLLFWWTSQHFFRRGLAASFIAVLIIGTLVGLDEARTVRRSLRTNTAFLLQGVFSFQFQSALPVVVENPKDFLQMTHYAGTGLANRLYYLDTPEEAIKYNGTVGLDTSVLDIGRVLHLHVERYNAFVVNHKHFLLFWGKPATTGLIGWQLSKLLADRAELRLVEQFGQRVLFSVTLRN